jgi:hypothetical protein
MWDPWHGRNIQSVRIAKRRNSLYRSAKGVCRTASGKIENSPSATMVLHSTHKTPAQN